MTRPQTCSKCGEEVRYGKRADLTGWLHRDPDVDHMPLFGGPLWTPERAAALDAELDRLRVRPVGEVDEEKGLQAIEFYTSRRVGLKGEAAKAYDALHTPEAKEVPPPEIPGHPIEVSDLRPRSGILGLANLILGKNKDKVQGWELRRLTYSRGPYVGASGEVLSIDDFIVLGATGPTIEHGYADPIDGWVPPGTRIAVAAWRNYEFDFGWAGVIDHEAKKIRTRPATSTDLRAWIKGEGLTPAPAGD